MPCTLYHGDAGYDNKHPGDAYSGSITHPWLARLEVSLAPISRISQIWPCTLPFFRETPMTLIALDAMGGDFSPRMPVEGALQAMRKGDMSVALVGNKALLHQELNRLGGAATYLQNRLSIVSATEKVEMEESATAPLKDKPDASIRVACRQVTEGAAGAMVSAGHTGATMVAAKHTFGTLPGIERPAIATSIPLRRGNILLLDGGANVDCKPAYLLQFARMGQLYARRVSGVEKPRVGLLNIGNEPGKGNDLVRQAHRLLSAEIPEFVGNLEPREMYRGKADVVVCDGFVGNLVLKTAEATGAQLRLLMRETPGRSPLIKVGVWMIQGFLTELLRRTDYREIGGSLLLGLNGVAVVAHGASSAKSMYNALRLARDCAESGLIDALNETFSTIN